MTQMQGKLEKLLKSFSKTTIKAELLKFFVLGCLLISFALRLYKLGVFELWGDEAASYSIASLPTVGKIFTYSSRSFYEHPSLFYICLHFWIKWVGKSEWLLRFPALFWGILSIALAWSLFKKLGNKESPLLTVFLLAVFPSLIALSQEARMYTLFISLSVAANWVLLVFLKRNRSVGIFFYIFVTILGFFTHYFFFWILLTHLLWAIYAKYRGEHVNLKLIAIVFLSLILLVALVFKGFTETVLRELKSPALATPIKERIRVIFLELTLVGEPRLLLEPLPLWTIVAVCSVWILSLCGGGMSLKSSRLGQIFCLFWLIIPTSGIIFSYGLARGRHISFVLPALLFFLSKSLCELVKKQKLVGLVLGILLSLNLVYGLNALYTLPKGSFGQAARFILDNDLPGDAVLLSFPMANLLAKYYLSSENLTIYNLPENLSFIPHEWSFPSEEQIDIKMREIFSKHPRLWLGPYTPAALDPEGKIEKWLNKNAFPVLKIWFPQSTFVALYLPPWAKPEERNSQLHVINGQFQIFLPMVAKGFAQYQLQPKELVPIAMQLNFGDILLLEKTFMDKTSFKAGEGIRLEFQWKVLKKPERDVLVSLSLKDLKGMLFAKQLSSLQGGSYPYTLWAPGDIITDHHGFLIPQGILPGIYELWLGLYLPCYDRYITVQGQSEIRIAQIQVQPGGPVPCPAVELNINLPEITLIGTDRWPEEVMQGQSLPLTFYWVPHTEDKFSLLVSLQDKWGKILAQSKETLDPAEGGVNVARRTISTLMIPGRLKPGKYIIQGEIKNEQTGKSFRWVLGKIKIQPLARSFRKPLVTAHFEAEVGKIAKLIGYKLEIPKAEPGGTLHLTLFWQAVGEPETNYTVFTHLVGPDGKIWGQKDNQPAKGSRPTSTWLRGEYITDEYIIPIDSTAPEGTYILYVGFYNPQTLERLPAFAAGGERFPHDSIPIAKIHITQK